MGLLKTLGIGKYIKKVKEYIDQRIADLIDSAPETYDTLREIAEYINSDGIRAEKILDDLSNHKGRIGVLEEKTKISEPIQIAGGPLANDIEKSENWPDDWYEDPNDKDNSMRIIPANTSLEDIITTLFLKPFPGTVSWSPITWDPSIGVPTVSLSNTGSLEVGTQITIKSTTAGTVSGNSRTSTCAATYGYFLADADGNPTGSHNEGNKTVSNTGSDDKKYTISYKWNDTSVSSSDKLTVGDGTNTLLVSQSGPTVSVNALPTTKVFASTNIKRVIPTEYDTLTDKKPDDKTLSNYKSYTINGMRYAFTGAVASGFVADSDSVRGLTKRTYSASSLTTLTAPAGNTQVIIAFPSSWGKLSEVRDSNALDAPITNDFILTDNVKVKGVNNFTAVDYKVYVKTSKVVLGDINYKIVIK